MSGRRLAYPTLPNRLSISLSEFPNIPEASTEYQLDTVEVLASGFPHPLDVGEEPVSDWLRDTAYSTSLSPDRERRVLLFMGRRSSATTCRSRVIWYVFWMSVVEDPPPAVQFDFVWIREPTSKDPEILHG